MKKECTYMICSILLLALGTIVYVLFRDPVLFTEPLCRLGINPPVINLNSGVGSYFIKYILPDVLWIVALLFYASTLKILTLRVIAILMAPLFEICQLFGLIEGSFDFIDLIIYILITLIFIKQWKRKGNSLQSLSNP